MVEFVVFIVVFGLLVFVHELGHFGAAKLFGVEVAEFGFGYPPRLARLGTWRGTTITLNWLPIGGFVRWSEGESIVGGLADKGRTVRAIVYTAGALMNLVLAIVLFTATFMAGAPTPYEGSGAGIYAVSSSSPAEKAQLRPGDTIVMLDGQQVRDSEQAGDLIRVKLGQPIDIVVERNGRTLSVISATPRTNPPANQGALGVSLGPPLRWQTYPFWQALPMGLRAPYYTLVGIYSYFRTMIRKQLPFEVSGPVGIYRATAQAARTGLPQVLEFTAMLSTQLFLLNLLPLPALDGGHLIFVLLEWLRRGRKIPPEKEGVVHLVGMAVLLACMAVVTYFDILRLLS